MSVGGDGRVAGRVRTTAGRVRHVAGVVVVTALGLVGLLLGLVALGFATTAPLTGCLVGGGGTTCAADAVTFADGVVRWLGTLVLLYSGGAQMLRAWRPAP